MPAHHYGEGIGHPSAGYHQQAWRIYPKQLQLQWSELRNCPPSSAVTPPHRHGQDCKSLSRHVVSVGPPHRFLCRSPFLIWLSYVQAALDSAQIRGSHLITCTHRHQPAFTAKPSYLISRPVVSRLNTTVTPGMPESRFDFPVGGHGGVYGGVPEALLGGASVP